MANITMMPLVVQSTADKPPRLQVYFSLNEVLASSRVRLIIYDEKLYAASPLGQRFESGKEMRKMRELDLSQPPILADEEVDPKLGAGSGVLLKLEGRVKFVKTSEGNKWFFEVQDLREENVSNLHGSIELLMVAEKDHAKLQQTSKVALISYLKDDVGRADGKLLVRMVLIKRAVSDTIPLNFLQNQQILSSFNPKHNKALGVRHQVKLPSLEVKKSAKLPSGGPPKPEKASATSRLVVPDLTGLWEAEPQPGEHPVLHVQINQAGQQAVGWYHRIGSGGGFPINKPPPAPAGVPQFDGLFTAFMGDGAMPSEGWPAVWSEYDKKDADPYSASLLPQSNPGKLRVLPGQSSDQLDLEIELVFEGPVGQATVKLVRYSQDARWSNAAIAALAPKAAREEMEALHRKPIPSTYWQQLSRFCSNANTKLVDAISDWEESTASPGVRVGLGTVVADLLDAELPSRSSRYRSKVLAHFRGYAGNHQITSRKGTKKTLREWIDGIVAEEFNLHRKAGLSDKDIYEKHLSRGFRTAGVSVSGNFIYTGDFEAPLGISGKVVVGGGISAFIVKFKKEDVKSGIRVAPPKTAWDPDLDYVGIMEEVGAGLMVGGGALQPGGASAQPGKVEFESAFDLDQKDLDGAHFTVVALTGPSASVAGFSFTTAKSSLITLSLKNGLELSAVVDTLLKPSTPRSIKKPKLGAEFNIVNVSMARGDILLNPKKPPRKPKKEEVPDVHEKHRASWFARTQVLYAKDGSTFTTASRRDLEIDLAVERVWFTLGDGFLICGAYASPEGTRAYNDLLTGLRADNTLQGLKDAFGPALKLSDQVVFGLGEEPSYKELLDPPSDDQKDGKKKIGDFSKAEQQRIKDEQADLYWKWRKTEISLQGSTVILVTLPKMGP
jgi:hypothetical protein